MWTLAAGVDCTTEYSQNTGATAHQHRQNQRPGRGDGSALRRRQSGVWLGNNRNHSLNLSEPNGLQANLSLQENTERPGEHGRAGMKCHSPALWSWFYDHPQQNMIVSTEH
ncbi:hypothetical protein NHX12_027331 [Muraenolepis orangiensis]|uniref:Uncharacterized protein n=1 Tax=Muraenolepis orangiensis TaxID=630683 RepID=A0A9Q0EGF8_9TELE|nr:hypothetical protein NHX12_027331 [Muraenolepis orangiensis]